MPRQDCETRQHFPPNEKVTDLCVIGDVHGHLQLALLVAARWQQELDVTFDAVLLAGDVGTFPDLSTLDKATRRHAAHNPCEIEIPLQWMTEPPAPWLERIFAPTAEGGLGLTCPVVMVHGNHEGFKLLAPLVDHAGFPDDVPITDLPFVDPGRHLRYLPSGWRTRTAAGLLVGSLGGIDPTQRKTRYHELAYLNEDAVEHILGGPTLDVLVTHAGPARLQNFPAGAPMLDPVLDSSTARSWFHGDSVRQPDIRRVGPTTVVPLSGVAFELHGRQAGEPGEDAWCQVHVSRDEVQVSRGRPSSWRDFKQRSWQRRPDGQLIAPQLAIP